MDRFLPAAIRPAVAFEVDGALTDPDGQAVTVTITKADGTALVTAAAATRVSLGVYRYNVADQTSLNRYSAAWTGAFTGDPLTVTSQFETVGGFYCPLSALRKQLPDEGKFPTADLVAGRQWFEETFEEHVGIALVPRFARATLDGSGCSSIGLPHMFVRRLLSAGTYSGATLTALTAPELADVVVRDTGYLNRRTLGSWGLGQDNVVVEYEHGLDACPADVSDACLVEVADKLQQDITNARGGRRTFVTDGSATIFERGVFETRIANKRADEYRARYRVPAVA